MDTILALVIRTFWGQLLKYHWNVTFRSLVWSNGMFWAGAWSTWCTNDGMTWTQRATCFCLSVIDNIYLTIATLRTRNKIWSLTSTLCTIEDRNDFQVLLPRIIFILKEVPNIEIRSSQTGVSCFTRYICSLLACVMKVSVWPVAATAGTTPIRRDGCLI